MKNILLSIKRNIYLVVSILVFASSIAFAASTMGVLGIGNNNDDTSVGYIYLGGLDESDYESVLNQKVSLWQSEATYVVVFQGYTYEINLDLFQFDISSTLSNLETGVKNQAYFTITEDNKNLLVDQLNISFTNEIIVGFDVESFVSHVLNDMGSLKTFKTYLLKDFLPETLPTHSMNMALVSNLSSDFVNAIVSESVYEISIEPKTRFSLLETFKDSTFTNEQLSIIASAMQKLLRNSPMTNYTFEQYPIMPTWAEAGMNVRILSVNQFDFSFYNPLEYSLTITVYKESDNELLFTLDSYPFISTFSSSTTILTSIPFQDLNFEDESVNEFTANVEIWDETTEDITYRVLVTPGVNGSIIAYTRTETLLSGETETITLYEEETMAVNAVYHYYTYLKDGE
ncbi:MAG: hypothetical protein CVV58_06350 [Tenericutes bacterium HGW-Tenericutes-3]|nr:MAG: hypothetical protein CVV58_06350 [Tenericutes bacterium HGW-Tenericutes-3]